MDQKQYPLDEAELEFQNAIRAWDKTETDEQRAVIAKELNRTRGILILDHGYTLEQLCELVDRTK